MKSKFCVPNNICTPKSAYIKLTQKKTVAGEKLLNLHIMAPDAIIKKYFMTAHFAKHLFPVILTAYRYCQREKSLSMTNIRATYCRIQNSFILSNTQLQKFILKFINTKTLLLLKISV